MPSGMVKPRLSFVTLIGTHLCGLYGKLASLEPLPAIPTSLSSLYFAASTCLDLASRFSRAPNSVIKAVPINLT